MWVAICSVTDVVPGAMREFIIGAPPHRLLVANVAGVFYATQSRCPHGQTALAQGYLCERRLVCRTHSYEFDLLTGLSAEDRDLRLRRYPVTVGGGEVLVDLDASVA